MKRLLIFIFILFTNGLFATTYHTLTFDGTNSFASDEDWPTSTAEYTAYCTWDASFLYLAYNGPHLASPNDTVRLYSTIFWYIDTDPQPDPKSGLGTDSAGTVWTQIMDQLPWYFDEQSWVLPFYADFYVKSSYQKADSAYVVYGSWLPDSNRWGRTALDTNYANLDTIVGYYEVKIPWDSLGNPSKIYILGYIVSTEWKSELRWDPDPQRDVGGTYGSWPAHSLEGGDGDKNADGKFNHWFTFRIMDGISPDQENGPPYVYDIPGETVNEGDPFSPIYLDSMVVDDLTPDSLISWTFSDENNLTVSMDENRVASIIPLDENWNGSDTLNFIASDEGAETDSDTASFTVLPVNDPPTAVDDSMTVDEDSSGSMNVLLNDSDIENDTLTVTDVTQGSHGTVTLVDDSTVSYAPEADFNGEDSFTYTVIDDEGAASTATVFVTVNPMNDKPRAVDDSSRTAQATAVDIDVILNDIDIDGDTLAVSGVMTAQHGTTSIVSDTTVRYIPETGFFGADSFDYVISDGHGENDTARVFITVNDPPIAVDDSASTNEDSMVTVNVIQNDSDTEGDSIWVSSVQPAVNGSVVNNDDGTVTYTPDADFFGTDSFTYVLEDTMGGTDTATVHVNIQSINDPPVIVNLPQQMTLGIQDSAKLDMTQYESDVDTPDSLLVWTFEESDPVAISFNYNPNTDTLTIYSSDIIGEFYLFCTLTDDSNATDKDTITITVEDLSGIAEMLNRVPEQFTLWQNYPNPFNPRTTIVFGLPKASPVKIDVFNIVGQEIATLVDGFLPAGYHQVQFDASLYASGIYLYRIQAGKYQQIKRMLLMK